MLAVRVVPDLDAALRAEAASGFGNAACVYTASGAAAAAAARAAVRPRQRALCTTALFRPMNRAASLGLV